MTKSLAITFLLLLLTSGAADGQTKPPPTGPAKPQPAKPQPAKPQPTKPQPRPTAGAAKAQPRFFIAAGVAAQPTTNSFTDLTTFPYLAETARLEGDYDVGDGIAFDVSGAVRVWRGLGVGVGVTRVTREADSEVTGSFPHPFFFNSNRTGTWTAAALDRKETGVHLSAMWLLPTPSRLAINVFGGPSFFTFDQIVVDEVEVIQSYPYDAIDARLTTGAIDGSVVGFHAGVDVGWFFTRHIGVGGLLRFTAAKKEMQIGDGESFDLDVGGVQGGGGIRLRF